jgi:hypothetical protein
MLAKGTCLLRFRVDCHEAVRHRLLPSSLHPRREGLFLHSRRHLPASWNGLPASGLGCQFASSPHIYVWRTKKRASCTSSPQFAKKRGELANRGVSAVSCVLCCASSPENPVRQTIGELEVLRRTENCVMEGRFHRENHRTALCSPRLQTSSPRASSASSVARIAFLAPRVSGNRSSTAASSVLELMPS